MTRRRRVTDPRGEARTSVPVRVRRRQAMAADGATRKGGSPALILVGSRRAALDAALDAGYAAAVVVDDGDRAPRGADRTASLPFEGCDSRAVRACLDALGREPAFAGVVPLTERAVVPAALLRDAVGLTGADAAVADRATDKVLMKRAIAAGGLPCASFVEGDGVVGGGELVRRLGLPLWIKQRRGSGMRGALRVTREDGVPARLAPGLIAESHVPGTETSVECFLAGGDVLFANVTEYLEPGWANVVPAPWDARVTAGLAGLGRDAARALGIRDGMIHMEAFVDGMAIRFGELAWRPPGGQIMPLMARAYGFDPWLALLEIATGERPVLPRRASRVAAVRMLYPGAGLVRAVRGVDAARSIEHVERVAVRVKEGATIGPREGTGQWCAFVVTAAAGRSAAVAALDAACDAISIEIEPGGGSGPRVGGH